MRRPKLGRLEGVVAVHRIISSLVLVLPLACSTEHLTPVQIADGEGWATGPAQPLDVQGTLVVLNKAEASASIVDCGSGREVVRLLTGAGPHEVAVSPDGRTAVITNYGEREPGNSLTVVDVPAGRVSKTIDLGEHERPHGIQLFPDGERMAVTAEVEETILLVNLKTGIVDAAIPTGQDLGHMLVLSPDGARIYVASIRSGTMTAIDVEQRQVIKVVPTGQGAEGIDVSPDGAEVWVANRAVNTISIINAQTLEVQDTVACGLTPIRVKFTGDGARVLVSNAGSGEVAVFDTRTRGELKRIEVGRETMEQAQFRYPTGAETHGPVPVGLLIEPQGIFAFVACSGAGTVAVINLAELKGAGVLPSGAGPDGLGWSSLVVDPAAGVAASE